MWALNVRQTREILERLDVSPNRKLGQNFLINARFVHTALEWAQLKPKDVVIEIGPGCGTLTGALVETGASVFAVEKDACFFRYIKDNFPVSICNEDALEFPIGNFNGTQPYKIVANLPYAIASIWLDRILEQIQLPECMVLLVQKEAADRWLSKAGTKNFGALSVNLQAAYSLKNKCHVGKNCFYPQPKVDSSLIHLVKRSDYFLFSSHIKHFLRQIFLHRRQQIGRVCKDIANEIAKAFLEFLLQNQLSHQVRAEELDLGIWIKFAKQLGRNFL